MPYLKKYCDPRHVSESFLGRSRERRIGMKHCRRADPGSLNFSRLLEAARQKRHTGEIGAPARQRKSGQTCDIATNLAAEILPADLLTIFSVNAKYKTCQVRDRSHNRRWTHMRRYLYRSRPSSSPADLNDDQL